MKNLLVGSSGLLSLLYLLNPTLGAFEFIPDNIPVVGNLDEAAATAVLISSLRYFGWDFTAYLRRPSNHPPTTP
jgi:hypothetical protein